VENAEPGPRIRSLALGATERMPAEAPPVRRQFAAGSGEIAVAYPRGPRRARTRISAADMRAALKRKP
jgi:hypothetical protein